MAYVECVVDNDYEILNEYPFTIRKKSNKREVRESLTGGGYPRVHLNLIDYSKHRIVAEQFIPNPDNKPCVDHISTNKEDNSIENLRWCTYKENNNNPISKKKLSEVNKGKHHTEQTKEKISRANYGRKLTLEQRKKISDARKEYWKKKS